MGDSTRSVIADLKQEGFNDYVYYTNFEVHGSVHQRRPVDLRRLLLESAEQLHQHPVRAGDILRGKVHSNDRLLICGSTFQGTVTTASQTNPIYAINGGCSDGTFLAGKPVKTQAITMPPTNSQMKTETRNDLPGQVPSPGCLFTGPTSVTLNSDGTMTVVSPWTKKTQTAARQHRNDARDVRCGRDRVQPARATPAAAKFTVPADNLIYVQNVPSTSTDPNYWAANTYPTGFTCSNKGTRNEGWSFGIDLPDDERGHALQLDRDRTGVRMPQRRSLHEGHPAGARDDGRRELHLRRRATSSTTTTSRTCSASSARTPCGSGTRCRTSSTTPAPAATAARPLLGTNRTIYGAILSVAHTFQVQNYHVGGARGTLKIVGSIAQNFRGTVGMGSNGYLKDYGYDTRLTYLSPPKFLVPTSTVFDTTQLAGVPAAFTKTGAAN